jgi:hypothetical protein
VQKPYPRTTKHSYLNKRKWSLEGTERLQSNWKPKAYQEAICSGTLNSKTVYHYILLTPSAPTDNFSFNWSGSKMQNFYCICSLGSIKPQTGFSIQKTLEEWETSLAMTSYKGLNSSKLKCIGSFYMLLESLEGWFIGLTNIDHLSGTKMRDSVNHNNI